MIIDQKNPTCWRHQSDGSSWQSQCIDDRNLSQLSSSLVRVLPLNQRLFTVALRKTEYFAYLDHFQSTDFSVLFPFKNTSKMHVLDAGCVVMTPITFCHFFHGSAQPSICHQCCPRSLYQGSFPFCEIQICSAPAYPQAKTEHEVWSEILLWGDKTYLAVCSKNWWLWEGAAGNIHDFHRSAPDPHPHNLSWARDNYSAERHFSHSFDSSVGRAEDCSIKSDILRSLVQIRLEGFCLSISISFTFIQTIPSIDYEAFPSSDKYWKRSVLYLLSKAIDDILISRGGGKRSKQDLLIRTNTKALHG